MYHHAVQFRPKWWAPVLHRAQPATPAVGHGGRGLLGAPRSIVSGPGPAVVGED